MLTRPKTVLIPDLEAGCSLGGLDHRRRRAVDATATPGRVSRYLCELIRRGEGRVRYLLHLRNAKKVVESLGVPEVIMLPDEYLAKTSPPDPGQNHRWAGMRSARALHAEGSSSPARGLSRLIILAHPECPPDVVAEGGLHRLDRRHVDSVGVKSRRESCC